MTAPATSPSAVKAYRHGTHRALPPSETVDRVRPFLATFGITRIANLTGLDRVGIPVVMVCRPNSRSSAVFHGKGIDMAAAKASGLMEAIETWHAEHAELPLRLGSVSDLARALRLVDADDLPKIPNSRYRPSLPMLWVEGEDLISRERTWVPYEVAHANGAAGDLPGRGSFAASTNGLASGNHRLEAVSHALCEVIERDATSLWNHGSPARQDATRLDLASISDPACRSVLQRLEEAELDAAAWDITSDVGVPAFLCMIAERSGAPGHVGRGAGCHPIPSIALLRALTEAAQVRTTYIVGSREDIEHDDYRPATLERRSRRTREMMRPVKAARDFAQTAGRSFDRFDAEVDWILERLKGVGVRQAVVVDLARPEFDIAVVRAVVPGLEGSDHHAGYTPGPRAQALAARRTSASRR